MSFFPATLNGIAEEGLPTPRIIRGQDQRIPVLPQAENSYLEHLEDELERATARARLFEGQVVELKGLLHKTMQASDRTESDNKKLRQAMAGTGGPGRKLTPQQLGQRGTQESRRRANAARRDGGIVELIPGVTFDHDSWRLVSGATTVALSPNESAMFRLLLIQRGRTAEFALLAMAVWKAENEWEVYHGLNVLACRLRGKLAKVGAAHLVTSVRNIGFRLEWAS